MHIRMKFLLLWGKLMSKKINDDKGKKGERDLMKTIFKMEEAAFVAIIVVSLCGKAPGEEITARFDEADRLYKEAMK